MTRLTTKATAAPAPAPRVRQRPAPKTEAAVVAAEAAGIPVTDVGKKSNVKPSKVMLERVRTYGTANVAMNAAKRVTDKEKKLLWPEMTEAGFALGDGFSAKTTIDGKEREFRAEIVQPDKQVVNVRKLFTALGGDLKALEKVPGIDKLLDIVGATQDAVTNAVGKNILNQALDNVKGDICLSIKEVK